MKKHTNTNILSRALDQVEVILSPVLSPRQPMELVEISFTALKEEELSFALHWLGVIAVSNIELAYTFVTEIGRARKQFDIKGIEVWLSESLSIYDREGLYPAMQALQDIAPFKKRYLQKTYICTLEEVKPRLDIFIRGLAGRGLDVKKGQEEIYTDTKHLYLPQSISRYRDKQKNVALYKAMACFLWAQTWYGTFRKKHHNSESTQDRLESYSNATLAKRLFLTLENIRLLAHIKRDLPGLHREMSALSPLLMPEERTWRVIAGRLEVRHCSVEDTFEALDVLMDLNIYLPETDYQGSLNLHEVSATIEDRNNSIVDSIQELKNNREITQQQLQQALEATSVPVPEKQGDGDDPEQNGDSNNSPAQIKNLRLKALIESLLQDVEILDQGALENVLEGYNQERQDTKIPSQKSIDNFSTETLFLDEWDYLRKNYRRDWCQVKCRNVEDTDNHFKRTTEDKYPFLVSQIRRIFEAMRDQPRYANRQTDGDEFDLDALVDMRTAGLAGEELSERLYIRRLNNERNVSVCLLIDMSGSTKGWINLAMRESLILFSEALKTLGDQYAIFGFSGLTRQRCEIYNIKEFDDHQYESISHRIGNIQAKDYTRMGFSIRFATNKLLKTQARHRILLMLSDGKPDDYDGYQGEYGIQDTRQAILEAQGQAINPYSITIDKQAQSYLPRLFGPGQYMILKDVSSLPLKLTEVYRKLSM